MDDQEGQNLFGPLYTYETLMELKKQKEKVKPTVKPDHWPDDTEIDPGEWINWLPDGWGQGKKITSGGKQLKCYISPPPESKRFFHKKDIDAFLEKKGLPKTAVKEKAPPAEEGKDPTSSIPRWPEDWDLPKDWRLAWRKLSGGNLHKCFFPPNNDEGFLYHKSEVLDYVSGQRTHLFPVSSSSLNPRQKDEVALKHEANAKPLAETQVSRFFPLEPPMNASSAVPSWSLLESSSCLEDAFVRYTALLVKRKFEENRELVAVHDLETKHQHARRICGIYYRMETGIESSPCYQKLLCYKIGDVETLACDRVYISFTTPAQCRITTAPELGAPSYAHCTVANSGLIADVEHLQGPWMVVDGLGDGCGMSEDSSMRVVVRRGKPAT